MKKIALLAVAGAFVALAQEPAQKPESSGWITLFDGRSLNGWHPEADAKWRVEGGVLIADSGGDGWLRSDRQFGNFRLEAEFRNVKGGNCGIFLRASAATKAGDPSNPASSYELQINNEDPKWATGSIEDVIQRIAAVNPEPNQWHKYEIAVHGDHFAVQLDGKKVLDGRDAKIKTGYIGLQHHKDMPVAFRNIKIQPSK
jgi:hypothetical protein